MLRDLGIREGMIKLYESVSMATLALRGRKAVSINRTGNEIS